VATDILPMQRYGDARVRENWNTGRKEKETSLLRNARPDRYIPFGDIVRFSHLWMTKIS
jgi:hypothetical protein